MPKLKRISGKEAVSILKKFGFREIRQKGSHTELAIGTLRGILRQAKVDVEEFARKL